MSEEAQSVQAGIARHGYRLVNAACAAVYLARGNSTAAWCPIMSLTQAVVDRQGYGGRVLRDVLAVLDVVAGAGEPHA